MAPAQKGSREKEFTFHSYIPAAEAHRRSWETLQQPSAAPCRVAGWEQPPPRLLPLRQPDLQLGVKVGPASGGWRHRPCLLRANRGRFARQRATAAPWHQGSCRHHHSPPWQFSPLISSPGYPLQLYPHISVRNSSLLYNLPGKPSPQPSGLHVVWVYFFVCELEHSSSAAEPRARCTQSSSSAGDHARSCLACGAASRRGGGNSTLLRNALWAAFESQTLIAHDSWCRHTWGWGYAAAAWLFPTLQPSPQLDSLRHPLLHPAAKAAFLLKDWKKKKKK